VEDHGIGIPEADQKHLFERFYRASNAGNVQGTGLGLHIMKHYVEMLKGSVKIESKLGKGTTVEISFAEV
jgi:signal transduction histidine kinase